MRDDYILQVNTHLINLEIRPHTTGEVNFLPSTSCGNRNSPDSASQDLQSQLYSEAKPPPTPLVYSSQAQQQISSHNMQNIITSAGVKSPSFPSVLNDVDQSCSFQNMSENLVGYSVPHFERSNIISNPKRLIQAKQHTQQIVAQQESQNVQHYIYQKQLQNQILGHAHYENNHPLFVQSHIHHNQRQQNISQPDHLPSSQQSPTHALQGHQLSPPTLQQAHPSLGESTPSSDSQQNQQSFVKQLTPHALQQYPHPFMRHQQQKVLMSQHSMLSSHQDQQLIGKHPDETNIQQNQLIGQPCSVSNIKQQQDNPGWSEQEQSTLSRMQLQQKHLLDQQNDIPNFRQQKLGPQQNVPETLQYSTHTLQQAKIMEERQKTQHTPSMSFFTQDQRSQSQVSQQVMSQLLTHQAQFQLQLGSQNKLNVLQRDMNQRVHASSLLQNQNTIEHQRQLFQFQRRPSEASSNSLAPNAETNIVDRREAVYQKIKSMKEMYMPILLSIQKKFINFLQNSRAQTTNSEQAERHRKCRLWLESTLGMLCRPPSPELTEERLLPIERNIIDFIKFNRVRRNIFSQQQGQKQLRPSGAHSPQTQIPQLQHIDNQMNTLMQWNLKNSVPVIQPNAALSLQHDSTPSLSSHLGGRAIQPSLVNTLQTSSDLESIPGSSMSSLQQGAVGSLEKIPMNATQQAQINISSQNDMNALQHNINYLQQNSNALHHQHLKQQFHQRQLSHQLKSDPYFHISSPQHLQAVSPRASQHSSPQTDQQSLISSSLSKSGTPLQPASSPIFSLSPSTSLAPSPMPGDNEKQTSSISSHSNAANGGQKQIVTSGPKSQSLVIGTPGISASPLLAEFASPDNNQGTASTIISGKTSETEKPIDRLIKVMKSISHKALSAFVGDIYSVVSMVDRIAVSKSGYDSKDAIDEDLVATVEHRMLANNFLLEDGIVTKRNVKCCSSSIPLTVVSSDGSVIDSFKLSNGMETSDLESTATSRIKRPRLEVNVALLNEIKEINRRLVNTMVDISTEDNTLTSAVSEVGQGTIVKCSFTSFTSIPNLTFPVLLIGLLVPSNYPNCSPVLLDKLTLELSEEPQDLLEKAKLRFSRSLRYLSQSMSLGDMVRSWDTCARAVILEYCVQNGGVDLSTRYGTWETV